MKQIIISLLLLISLPLLGQRNDDTDKDRQIKGLVILGMNLSQVDGDEVIGYNKAGWNAGVGAMLPLGKGFAFNLETLFNQKGAYKTYTVAGDSTGVPYYKLRLDYLDVPFYVTYEDRRIFTAGLGFSWGRRVGYREIERGYVKDSSSRYARNDWDVIVDVQLRVWQHLKVDVRYAYSMAKIRTRNFGPNQAGDTWTRDQFNNMVSLRAIYILNEKYVAPPPDRKKKKTQSTAAVAAWNL